jgi:hypothetical protein
MKTINIHSTFIPLIIINIINHHQHPMIPTINEDDQHTLNQSSMPSTIIINHHHQPSTPRYNGQPISWTQGQ